MEIRNIIRNRRQELGLTMKELADACGVSEGTISRWESGHINDIKRGKISLLSKILEIPPEVIMGWETDADRFQKTADKFNKSHTYILTGKDELHIQDYMKLNNDMKKRISAYTKALLQAQSAEEDVLLAAHARTDIDATPEEVKEDIDMVKAMKDED